MKNHLFLLLIFITTVWVATGCKSKNAEGKDMPKGKGAPPVAVSSLVIAQQELENKIEVAGTILPNEKVDLKSELSGRITGLFFKEGTRVEKGALLVKIYDQDIRAQIKKVNSQLKLSQTEEARKKKLLDIGGATQEEFDIASAQTEALAADLELLQAQLRKTQIVAPFSGVIGLRTVSEGENVSPSTLIASLQQIDPVKLEFDIPERYSVFVNQGAKIHYTISGADKTFEGTVYAIEPMIDVATRTLKVRALSPNKGQVLKPGSFVRIELLLGKDPKAIMVPTESVVPGVKGSKVFVFRNGRAISQNVKTGFRNERNIQVVEGLEVNDTIITSGIMQLKDSSNVVLKKKKQG